MVSIPKRTSVTWSEERGQKIMMQAEFQATSEQQKIIDWMLEGKGHAVVEALAGTGKTTLLLELITEYVRKFGYVDAAYLQFNKKIKEESAEKIYERRLHKNVKVLTLNGLGHRVLTEHSDLDLNIDTSKLFTTITDVLNAEIQAVESEMRTSDDLSFELLNDKFFKFARSQLRQFVNKFRTTNLNALNFAPLMMLLEDYNLPTPWDIGRFSLDPTKLRRWMIGLLPRIETQLIQQYTKTGIIDYDDQVWLPIRLDIHPENFPSYAVILVDEAQDLNEVQQLLVMKCTKPTSRLVVVGDENQAIYRFRGALNDSINRFTTRLEGEVNRFPLTRCWRCPEKILDTVRYHVPEIWSGIEGGKVSFSDFVEILDLTEPDDMILCRLNFPLFITFYQFLKADKAAYLLGRDLIKTLLAVAKDVVRQRGFDWDKFDLYTDRWRNNQVQKIVSKNGGDHEDPKVQLINDQAHILVEIYDHTSFDGIPALKNHLEQIFTEKDDAVMLSTVHRAKGLEADHVIFIERIGEKLFSPLKSQFADEIEENNLIYIARTRAKQRLTIINTEGGSYGMVAPRERTPVRVEIEEEKVGLDRWF